MAAVNVCIGGEAGQGLVTVGALITKALVRSGYEINVYQDYLSRIRGGHNTYRVRFGPDPVLAPCEAIDVLVCLGKETFPLFRDSLSERAVVVAGEDMAVDWPRVFRVPFKDLAGKAIYENTVALGVLASTICLDVAVLEELLDDTFRKKGDKIVAANVEVLRRSFAWKEGQESIFECPAPPAGTRGRMALNGNEAIALGAMAAGCNFVSFYPMTPSTSVPLTLIQHAQETGVVVEQAEDEIAAINMVLGASYAGARALTATSGGGFALMCEGVSLAGMIEQPLVIVLAMRPGPATGLPTRTEQGDLNLALYSGHGEFPRAILSPGTAEQCFWLTHRAFDQAEKWQGPAFVLTDQYQADCYSAVRPFDLDALPPVSAPLQKPDDEEGYVRFAPNEETGVSPRALPGLSKALVVVDSDEHTPDGHITEDLGVRTAMVHKRAKKLDGLRADALAPEYFGHEQPKTLLVCWGSTRGAALEAMERLSASGETAGVLHFGQVYPLRPNDFLHRFEKAGRVVCVEGNLTGQFADLVHRESGYRIERKVLRYDGAPFTPEYILAGLAGLE
ncbi:2-oxoacid:acceptor oxidoreductase, alpha subunit [Alkalidesulfovibrio alkalitolerans DSM 16529]|jgi:2-oxoglutarate ferredoxin oxidoreductase subunit alpha|uniref:2-oxoacid:acceptor oxidoreductase, alpha subunit n=1 Tax=Alkalidesulfovibrio alkalitolerans DSM 16529 TaxID=1121439 RepID=S7TE01_9BACT|nr:2-oxoacid:acceptor oxidoreductase subunit alpha [Alkalidesulfovibrio alkalitolerans]EPR34921.1 2-oxoacid:acceptor oxidoreductase, alpha subunit [Alkalidesulfovibrio alkalitolerans DSM 16529]